jgi:hypothetical protein
MKDVIPIFFHMLMNIKIFHWNTFSFAQHKATDELHGELQTLIDQFIEVYMGKYSRTRFEESFSVEVHDFDETDFKKLLEYYITFLRKDLIKYLKQSDTDLLNIRDEMLGLFNKTLYLFTLN